MTGIISRRAHLQHLADRVLDRAAGKGWPAVTYQASFITVEQHRTGERKLEGNSSLWNIAWDVEADCRDHPVTVNSGEAAWRGFLASAWYADLHGADAALQRC